MTAHTVRSALRAKLPPYMLPLRWRTMSALPKNVNGKIDRRELRQLFAAQPQPVVGEDQPLGG